MDKNKQENKGFQSFSDIFKNKKTVSKPPAYPWQELALQVIKDLSVPGFKRSSVFKACRDMPAEKIKTALNDTKELCKSGSQWQYFFKIVSELKKEEQKK